MKKIKVEIWSDIMCPFCYIGKRNFEEALKQFPEADQVDVEWKSFQLDPEMPKQTSRHNVYEYLAQRKGISLEQSKEMHRNVVDMARQAGLNYDFDKTVVANSFDAHRLIQFAKTKNLGDEAEEVFFKAYFVNGKDLGDHSTLLELTKEIGLNEKEAQAVIGSNTYTTEVESDMDEAAHLGIRGVPFFVFNRKYGVSGAQPANIFLNALEDSFAEENKAER